MWNENQNFAVVRTELDEVFYQNFQYNDTNPGIATANTSDLFRPQTIDRQAYIEETFAGSGLFPVIGETETVPLSTPKVANKLTTPVLDFAQGIELSKDLFDDNMHGVWSKAVADLALMARISQDDNSFKWFRNAFTTSLTADGNAFCSTHTLIGGGTLSNTLGATALSQTSLNTAIISLRQQKNQKGVIMGNAPAFLLVPSPLFKLAVQLTDSALIPGSGNNDINVYRSAYGITVYTSPYLDAVAGGSDTAWWLLSRNHSVTRLIRQGIETSLRDWTMSDNRTYFYQANFREQTYAPDYIGVIGSTGA